MNVQPNLRMDKAAFLAWIQEATVRIAALQLELPMADIYAGINVD
jgi:hypothetical protein